MARQNSDTFQILTKDLERDRIGNLVLLHGEEQFLVDWSLARLEETYVSPATRTLDRQTFILGETPLSEILSACETFPLFSQRKMVVLSDCMSVWKRDQRAVSEEELKQFLSFLEDLPDHLLLVLMTAETEADRRGSETPLHKLIRAKGKIYHFGLLDREYLIKFIRKRFRTAGKQVTSRQVQRLADESGYLNRDADYTLYNLENDITKILYRNRDAVISDDSIQDCLSDRPEHGMFRLLDAIGANRKQDAFRILHQLCKSGERPMQLLGRIIGQLEIMLQAAELKEKGYTLPEIQDLTGIHEYRLKKALGMANQYEVKDLRRILLAALSVEDQITGGYLEDIPALELFIAEI